MDGLMGNASQVDAQSIAREMGPVLVQGEQVQLAYKVIRDFFVFTERRLILVDKQGMTGKKVEYHSIPYRSITHLSVETAGHFDLDAELKIWLSGAQEPLRKQFRAGDNIMAVQQALAWYAAR
ncbi:PH domain-containing protein [Sorangium sp. So ce429]